MRFYKELIKEILKTRDVEKAKKKIILKYKPKFPPGYIEILTHANKQERKKLFGILKTKPTRTLSGVAPVAVMSMPIKCKHGACIMCPSKVDQGVPQSYTGKEPAARRAIRNKFHPYLQVFNRLEHYMLLGNYPEKVELIIMGGTFTSFNLKYQEWFVKNCLQAMNDFGKMGFEEFFEFFELTKGKDLSEERTERIISKILKKIKNKSLEQVQKENEKTKIRCVAMVFETRPDYCTEKEIKNMLRFGGTRVELGIQSVYDDVLKKMQRKHDVKASIKATKLLKDSGFKITYHVMPGAYGSTVKRDIKMFEILFSNPNFMPDGLKIYPCMVVEDSRLYKIWKQGKFKPLTTTKAADLIVKAKKYVPTWCRIMRIQRDIPSFMIKSGVDITNLRQYIHEYYNFNCKCIRCREIGLKFRNKDFNVGEIKLIKREYEASGSKEIFLSYEDIKNNALIGFLRLRLLKDKAFVRELHVYGSLTKLGKKGNWQHKGYGKRLLKEAEDIVKKNKIKKLYIISGVGVRNYYKKLRYKKDNFYMSKIIS